MKRFRPLLALLALAASGAALAQEDPSSPTSTSGFLRSGTTLRFCLDQQNPIWRFEQDLALAVARSLGRQAEFYVHRQPLPDLDTAPQPLDRLELLRLFAHHCDIYPGLVGSTTPAFDYPADEQMYATRPYLRASYLFVSRDPRVKTLADLPRTAPLSMERGGLPAYLMYATRRGQFTDRPVDTAARLVQDLVKGQARAGIVFAPQLYGRQKDLAKVGLSATPVTTLPNMTWYVIYGLRRDRPSLRTQLDSALARLIQRGEVQKLLVKHGLNRPGITVAGVSDRRPTSESMNDR
ncbi:transporter substrate-binding domain-containing protein [Deinococcus metallilatus]|uniref:ABC-type amino acid transport substrate-binding protein n=1 Tax=Deinococcus metallilatus TaxID=1211322 RepID=A0AAJ5JYU9_9DEIO|nr:transporter substrate-binding domain-containing protein [Deinococcus metallilatus]MBB5294504.1 ABC-type amino acid transport substrate-binding protein [Deinococcus metallilatus]QBY07554.1 transporter substrate-binding domain-containing protein [Deinococcus metallilatus]RXJ13970.1 transporter substrate-binding domain-containing protein [Deinococcus metallilatus]TLK29935.1 transporter substrate-binding domain-containing protein [Deinococcus metallilatus]GMA15719.1 hypothetical protein GCM1002